VRPDPAPAPRQGRWQRWLDANGERFLLFARQQTRTEADAQDVLQDALTESWRKSAGRVPDRALVIATIRRRAMDLGRSLDRRSRREQDFCGERPAWFVEDFSAGDTGAHLAQAIERLSEPLREVLILRIWEDLSFPAIARLTDVPTSTASSRYQYALSQLRECMTELKP
jgi:RNA polymerase sigma-70 factor (ECF subfamily)